MVQFHYVVYFDTGTNMWKLDYELTSQRFPDGTIWDGEDWKSLANSRDADIEEEVFNELQEILHKVNENKLEE